GPPPLRRRARRRAGDRDRSAGDHARAADPAAQPRLQPAVVRRAGLLRSGPAGHPSPPVGDRDARPVPLRARDRLHLDQLRSRLRPAAPDGGVVRADPGLGGRHAAGSHRGLLLRARAMAAPEPEGDRPDRSAERRHPPRAARLRPRRLHRRRLRPDRDGPFRAARRRPCPRGARAAAAQEFHGLHAAPCERQRRAGRLRHRRRPRRVRAEPQDAGPLLPGARRRGVSNRARLRPQRRRPRAPLRHHRADVQLPRRVRAGGGAVRRVAGRLFRARARVAGGPGRPGAGRPGGDRRRRPHGDAPRSALRPQHLHGLRHLPGRPSRTAGFLTHDLSVPMTHTRSADTAVVLLNLGGPDALAWVEPFLINLFSDREIIELPGGASLQPVLARAIAKLRGPSVRRNYARIGGGSPQLRPTTRQAAALEERLNSGCAERSFRVFVAMRYSRPSSEDALEAIAAAGIRRIVTLTLFPHYSKATTGSSRRELERALARPAWKNFGFEVTHIDQYPDNAQYLDAMSHTVIEGWRSIPEARRVRPVLLCSAHGLPQKFIDRGDPYADHIELTRRGILERVKL